MFDPIKRVAPEFVLQRKGGALQNLFDPIKIKRVAPEFVRLRKGAAPQNFTEFHRKLRALWKTIKANSISIVEILQYENSNKLN